VHGETRPYKYIDIEHRVIPVVKPQSSTLTNIEPLFTSLVKTQNIFFMCSNPFNPIKLLLVPIISRPISAQIHYRLSHLQDNNSFIVFCWVAGHVSAPKRKAADIAAKKYLQTNSTRVTAPHNRYPFLLHCEIYAA
jgi:hypothetical protein